VHTHGRRIPVALSLTDRRDGVRVPDFLAVVIGNGGADNDLDDWSFNVFERRDFRELSIEEFRERVVSTEDEVDLWRVSADGAIRWSGRQDE
jgi:hypothetical protein